MNNLTGGQPTFNGAIPSEGPMAFQTAIKYLGEKQEIDLSNLMTTGRVSGIQTVFIDLSNFEYDVRIYAEGSAQTILAKKKTQGYYPILSTNLLKYIITSEGLGDFNIQFINFPIALGVWGINEIRGEKGDTGVEGPKGDTGGEGPKGDDGLNGIAIIENTSDGFTIYSNPTLNEIKFKKLIAGVGIELLENDESIEIINTIDSAGGGGDAGGGGGTVGDGGQPPSYMTLSFDVADLPVYGDTLIITDPDINLVGDDIRYQDGSIYLDDGLYDIEIKSDLTISTGENAIAVYLDDEYYYASISTTAKVDSVSGGWFNTILRHKMRVNLGGNSELFLKVGNITNVVDTATIQIIINKISALNGNGTGGEG